MKEAIGDFFHNNQYELGFDFALDPSAYKAEIARRRRELAKR